MQASTKGIAQELCNDYIFRAEGKVRLCGINIVCLLSDQFNHHCVFGLEKPQKWEERSF